jgi:hypothetical protein
MPVVLPLNQTKSRKLRLENQNFFLELFIKSGLSQESFCEQHNLNKNTFKNWVYLHKKATKLLPHPVFLPLNLNDNNNDDDDCIKTQACSQSIVDQPLKPSSDLTMNLSSPYTATITHKSFSVSIPTGFDPSYLQQILQIVVAL